MSDCKLEKMMYLRESFMKALADARKDVLQEWPLDISKKKSQQVVRDTVLKGVEEMFESLAHLKAWKPHKTVSEDPDFNRSEFLEEYVDAFNYFLSVLIMLDVDAEEFFDAYVKKDRIIHDRIKQNY